MSGLHKGIRSACLVDLILFAIIALLLSQCSCMSATLPVEPAPASLVVKGVSTPAVIYTSTPELIRKVCLTADAVNLRTGAGTGFESKAVLSAGDTLTLTGELVIAPDMGLWWPVDTETGSGYINARYVCEE
mgnify:CR=1 FL=1